jgi:uncharacterized membrane protein
MQGNRTDNIPPGIPTDTVTYHWVSVMLRIGMYASFAMMVGGMVWWLLAGSPGSETVESIAIPVDRIGPELANLNPLALTSLGVVALLLTPGLTLFTSAVTYARAREWVFAGLSTLLALVITFGIALSLGWRL